MRLFWDEPVYKVYYPNGPINESLKSPEIKTIINMLNEFKTETEKLRDQIMVKVKEFQYKQLQNNNIHKIDFSEIEDNIKALLFITNKFLETLYLVENLNNYDNPKKYHKKFSPNLLSELKHLRFYHIIKNNKKVTIEYWIQEFFEAFMKDSNFIHASKKLEDLTSKSKSIFSDKHKEIVLVSIFT